MVSPIDERSKLISDNQRSVDAPEESKTAGTSYFDKKWTLQEYYEELKQPIQHPDPNNIDDPGYYKKYAINVPPPEAYYIYDERKDAVATNKATQNDRRVYYGWNNIQPFEQKGMDDLKAWVQNKGIKQMPPGFVERDWVKWIQASFYDVEKAGEKLLKHITWL